MTVGAAIRRGRERVLQRADRLLGSAAPEEAGDGADAGCASASCKLINRERRRAEAGQPAEIMAKMNSLIDDEIIEALYAASRAGVASA